MSSTLVHHSCLSRSLILILCYLHYFNFHCLLKIISPTQRGKKKSDSKAIKKYLSSLVSIVRLKRKKKKVWPVKKEKNSVWIFGTGFFPIFLHVKEFFTCTRLGSCFFVRFFNPIAPLGAFVFLRQFFYRRFFFLLCGFGFSVFNPIVRRTPSGLNPDAAPPPYRLCVFSSNLIKKTSPLLSHYFLHYFPFRFGFNSSNLIYV